MVYHIKLLVNEVDVRLLLIFCVDRVAHGGRNGEQVGVLEADIREGEAPNYVSCLFVDQNPIEPLALHSCACLIFCAYQHKIFIVAARYVLH